MIGRLARLAAPAAAACYRAYYATLELRGLPPEGGVIHPASYPFDREIFAMCERDALALGGMIASTRLTVLLALGRDGDWAGPLLTRLGFGVVRGSSLRGGARALTELIRTLRAAPHPAAIVVDGPLGPSGVARPGIVLAALRSGRPIRALGVAAKRAITFRRTWSGIYLPLPFTRVVMACDEPTPVPAGADREEIAAIAAALSGRLAEVRSRALEGVALWDHGRLLAPAQRDRAGAARALEQRS